MILRSVFRFRHWVLPSVFSSAIYEKEAKFHIYNDRDSRDNEIFRYIIRESIQILCFSERVSVSNETSSYIRYKLSRTLRSEDDYNVPIITCFSSNDDDALPGGLTLYIFIFAQQHSLIYIIIFDSIVAAYTEAHFVLSSSRNHPKLIWPRHRGALLFRIFIFIVPQLKEHTNLAHNSKQLECFLKDHLDWKIFMFLICSPHNQDLKDKRIQIVLSQCFRTDTFQKYETFVDKNF